VQGQGRSPSKREKYRCVPARTPELDEMHKNHEAHVVAWRQLLTSVRRTEQQTSRGAYILRGLRLPHHRGQIKHSTIAVLLSGVVHRKSIDI
jgi:hypothetical protein